MAHDQPDAFHPVRSAQPPQFGVDANQAVADELHAPVGPGQGLQDRAVEDEGTPHLPRGPQRVVQRPQRVVQRGVIVGAQVATQPDEGAVQGLVHGP